jgi:hypothetical protein
MDCWEINGHTVEYFDDEHLYLVDGIEVPSITEILKLKFGNKYSNVDSDILKKAAEKGTQVHNAIEKYCKTGEKENLKEVKNFIFLQKKYGFEVLENEVPVILFYEGKPVSAGRLDLTLKFKEMIGGADIKRTSVLDKEYLAYKLNLYRVAYRQCYGINWEFLKGLHLREDKRKFIDIPINEEMALNLVKKYLETENKNG